MNTGIAFQVTSLCLSEKAKKVTTVLATPAAVTKIPPAKSPPTTICCFLGSWSRRTYGIGTKRIIKSVDVFMQPAASRCCTSLMQACGVADSVQYASGGLCTWSTSVSRLFWVLIVGVPALEQGNEKEDKAVESDKTRDKNYQVSITAPLVDRGQSVDQRQHRQFCQVC